MNIHNDLSKKDCKWLNTCVGSKNYNYFFNIVVSCLFLVSIQVGVGIYHIIKLFTSANEYTQRCKQYLSKSQSQLSHHIRLVQDSYPLLIISRPVMIGLQIGIVACLLPAIYLLAQLLVFHLQLQHEGITTYDYIVRTRKRRLQRLRDAAVGLPYHILT